MASLESVEAPYSKLNMAIGKLLKERGYIQDLSKDERKIVITLKYENRKPVLTGVERVSKPGRRVYRGSKRLPRVLGGIGMAIISTPKGIMSDHEARKIGLGGEIMAQVW